jgi:hypothetical protein
MPWYPQVLGLFGDRRYPVLIEAANEGAVAAPGKPAVLALTLRNTSGRAVRVKPTLVPPVGFSGNAPTPFVLAADAEESVTVELTAKEPGLAGEVAMRLELIPSEGAVVQRTIPFAVHSVAGIERRLLRITEAEVQAPMQVVGTGEQAYVDDVRPTSFSGNPLKADGDAGGKCVWTVTLDEPRQFILWAEVKWLDDKGNSFHISIEGKPESVLGNTGAIGPWIWVKGPVLDLAAGTYRVVVRTREEGAKLGGIWLTDLPEDTPPPARQ